MHTPWRRTPSQRPLDPKAIVAGLYEAVLGREASDEEIGPYAAHLAGGGSFPGLVAEMMASPECQLTFFRNPSFRRLVAPDSLAPDTGRLYLWHLPKTGGTSLRAMLKAHFDPLEFCDGLTLSELHRLSPARLHSFRVIVGHFGPMLPPLLADVPLITTTLVREPESMVASTYCQWRDHGPPGHLFTELSRGLPFDDWCRRDEVRSLWSDPQARALALRRTVAAWPGPSESPEGEGAVVDAVPIDDLRTLALGYLDGIDIVGTTEDLLAVYRTCTDRLGLAPRNASTAHENVGKGLGVPLSDDTRKWLLAHNTVDRELVARVRDRRHELTPP